MAMPVSVQQVSSQSLNHLGLVAGMYEELGIGQVLDQAIAQDTARRVATVGQLVKAMVLNGLGFVNRALYLTPQFFQNKPVERLIGAGISAAQLNDDALGRALDALYEADVTLLFSLVTAEACRRLGLQECVAHWDTTSFHLDGDYNHDEPPSEEAKVIHITPGYSRDHRPDLNQVVLSLIVEQRARLPLWMQPLSGNSADTLSVGQAIEQPIDQLQAQQGVEYWLSDSVLFSEANLQRLATHRAKWITRVPERLSLVQHVLDDPCRGQSRALAPGYRCRTLEVEYAGIKQRWLVILSLAALQRAVPTVTRTLLADSQAEYQAFLKLCHQRFACAADAQRALEQFCQGLSTLRLDEAEVVAVHKHSRPGRPAPSAVPTVVGYQIQGAPYLPSDQRLWRAYRSACFVLATNELNSAKLSDLAVLQMYKHQHQVEIC
jgi:transposase